MKQPDAIVQAYAAGEMLKRFSIATSGANWMNVPADARNTLRASALGVYVTAIRGLNCDGWVMSVPIGAPGTSRMLPVPSTT